MVGTATAQTFAEAMSGANAEATAGRWSQALERLLAAQELATTNDERIELSLAVESAGTALHQANQFVDARRAFEVTLALRRQVHGDADHVGLAVAMGNLAGCLRSLGLLRDAASLIESALAMKRRLLDPVDPSIARSLYQLGSCRQMLGELAAALALYEEALTIFTRHFGDEDRAEIAMCAGNAAVCLQNMGQLEEALARHEQAVAMSRRLRANGILARSVANLGGCLHLLGRTAEALACFDEALALPRRPGGDGPEVAAILRDSGACLVSLGRGDEALGRLREALVIIERLHPGVDHPELAHAKDNLANVLDALDRFEEALPHHQEALDMRRRLFANDYHPAVALSHGNLAGCLLGCGRTDEALRHYEAALSSMQRLHRDADHHDIAVTLTNIGVGLQESGRHQDALERLRAAQAMLSRLFGAIDHPATAACLSGIGRTLQALGRRAEAIEALTQACDMVERLRAGAAMAPELKQSFFDQMKRSALFERLQLLCQADDPALAFAVAERGRSRDLLDLLAQQSFDPLLLAEQRAGRRGEPDAVQRLRRLRDDIAAAAVAADRVLHEFGEVAAAGPATAELDARRAELRARSEEVARQQRRLHGERAAAVADVAPGGPVRTAAEVRACLLEGEVLLEFVVTADAGLVYLVTRDTLEAHSLPAAHETIERELPALLAVGSPSRMAARGRDPEPGSPPPIEAVQAGRRLFDSLVPPPVWQRLRSAKRVFLAVHRQLHLLPFELLVTDVVDGVPQQWIQNGPPISYVPSGSALHWLRQQAAAARRVGTRLDLFVVGDPREDAVEPELPERGAVVLAVADDGGAALGGLQLRDVLVSYDGVALGDDKDLRAAIAVTSAAIEDGKRLDDAIPVEVWRRGTKSRLMVARGPLGIEVGSGPARAAYAAALQAEPERPVVRGGDVERLRRLSPLVQARAETEAIAKLFEAKQGRVERRVGADATEPAVYSLAPQAEYLHFACHGLAEEHAGQSLSMLVLSQPKDVLPGDDGLLKLSDLLSRWRGRLAATRLVVLSACRTNVGPTFRDDAPQALPIGFLFAGAPAVISTLWAVDDASTRELMTDFYGRLLAGETDRLAAFTAAKRALRAKYPDPFHWAPFLYMGSPE